MARILVISNLFPPHAQGGYELACGDVVESWRAAGHEVSVLSGAAGDLPFTSVHRPVPKVTARPGIERRAQRAIRDALAARPDVVSVWNLAGLPMAMLSTLAAAAVPLVYVVADGWPTRSPSSDPWLHALGRLPASVAAMIGAITSVPSRLPPLGPTGRWVFCSRSLRDEVIAQAPRQGPFADTAITPLGVSLDDFPPVDPPDERPWRGRILFVGRLDAVKGVDTLVRAMAQLPDATLEIIGPAEPHHVDRLQRLIAALGSADQVHIDSAPRDQLAARYRMADVCVFPSEWAEPFGIVPLEAMACATPVVATGSGGSGEFLSDGENALLFPAGDADRLAAAVTRLAADAGLRRHLVTGGLATAYRYTTTRLAEDLLAQHLDQIPRRSALDTG